MSKPQNYPEFATADQVDPTSGQLNVDEPNAAKKLSGFTRNEIPPRQDLNWLFRTNNEWVEYFDEILDMGGSPTYTTDLLSDDEYDTRDYGRLCRIALNAQNDLATVKLRVSYRGQSNFAEYVLTARQTDALNSDPECKILCTFLDDALIDGSIDAQLSVTSLKAFYIVSATESYIDVYLDASTLSDNRYFAYQFFYVDLFGDATFTPYNSEDAVDLSTATDSEDAWDVTSRPGPGMIVSSGLITISNENILFDVYPGAKEVTVDFYDIDSGTTATNYVRLRDSGGTESSGYSASWGYVQNDGSANAQDISTGFITGSGLDATSIENGSVTLRCLNPSEGTIWSASGVVFDDYDTGTDYRMKNISGTKELDDPLEGVLFQGATGIDSGFVSFTARY